MKKQQQKRRKPLQELRSRGAATRAGATRKISKSTSSGNVTNLKARKSSSSTKTGTRSLKVPKKEKKSSQSMIAGVAVAVVALLYFGYGKFFDSSDREVVDGNPAKVRQPADDNPDKVVQPSGKVYGKVQLLGYDKYKQKAYVNGKPASMGILSDIKVEAETDLVLRIQKVGRVHFIKKNQSTSGRQCFRQSSRNASGILWLSGHIKKLYQRKTPFLFVWRGSHRKSAYPKRWRNRFSGGGRQHWTCHT